MAEARQRGLGRGLSALLDDAGSTPQRAPTSAGPPRELPIEALERNEEQPRSVFDEALMQELTASVRDRGILQPILVRQLPGSSDRWQIVAGERRWRAAQKAGLTSVPVIVREFTDAEVLESAIVENVQRADLNPIEEAMALQTLMRRFGHTQETVAGIVGKSRSHVANSLRLLNLPQVVQLFVEQGKLSAGHARALVTTASPEALAAKVMAEDLSVRQTENLARSTALHNPDEPPLRRRSRAPVPSRGAAADADIEVLENDLSEVLGVAVSLRDQGGRGELRLSYSSLEQLDDLCARLMRPVR